jgi:predicted DNA-binding transcriptional regulator YafY
MELNLTKYIGRDMELIYVDSRNRISRRTVLLRSVHGSVIRAYCYRRNAPRCFRTDRILAILPREKDAG